MSKRIQYLATILMILSVMVLPMQGCGLGSKDISNQTDKQSTSQSKKHTENSPDNTKTQDIVFDPFFVKYIMSGEKQDTAQKVAADMQTRVPEDYTKITAGQDGSIVATVTEKQRQKNIKWHQEMNSKFEQTFLCNGKKPCSYRYRPYEKDRKLSVWLDKNISKLGASAILYGNPLSYGYLYYLKGGTGPWDMQITVYNCHTGKMVQQFMESQSPGDFDPNTFGA
ncbi:hypothetical protein OZX62_00075 [Bifidobacterium sp. ESL0690]|uniref:hypothetical protein n=1 Tax=Bifidobacterium sp. ESL0690 TaxID=2983214 RepID=UPI0023FA085B|nr:hypothetical protein [Bifidobacterium sp. ESL0690]WEV46748.1 hypothetical protein OZX62_00075 [Bifidobacterium sp. ESL0690]